MIDTGKKLEIEYTLSDPKNWVAIWKSVKHWNRVDEDIAQVERLPD